MSKRQQMPQFLENTLGKSAIVFNVTSADEKQSDELGIPANNERRR